jgi:hypothetical protein
MELREAESIFVMDYSLPDSDAFFRYLYGLGSVGPATIERFWVYNPDASGTTEGRFAKLLGPSAEARFEYSKLEFGQAVAAVRKALRVP